MIVQPETVQIVQPKSGQMPKILELITLTNHIDTVVVAKATKNACSIYYANKEHLAKRESLFPKSVCKNI